MGHYKMSSMNVKISDEKEKNNWTEAIFEYIAV